MATSQRLTRPFGLLATAMLVLWVAGCPKPDTDAYVRSLEKLAELTEQHAGDCRGMGRALEKFFEAEGEPLRTYPEQASRLSRRERAELSGPVYGPRVRKAMERLVPGHKECVRHPSVKKAFAGL